MHCIHILSDFNKHTDTAHLKHRQVHYIMYICTSTIHIINVSTRYTYILYILRTGRHQTPYDDDNNVDDAMLIILYNKMSWS